MNQPAASDLRHPGGETESRNSQDTDRHNPSSKRRKPSAARTPRALETEVRELDQNGNWPHRGGRPTASNFYQLAAVVGVCFTFAAGLTAQAGDILRGGAPAGIPGARPQIGGRAANASRTSANAGDALARTTKAVQAVKAMQNAARNLAIKGPNNLGMNPNRPGVKLPSVPNGLAIGGLKVAPNVPSTLPTGGIPGVWSGAQLPTQKQVGFQTIVTVKQEQPKALMTWESFNIGKETTLKFDQSAGGSEKNKWIAFNKVEDPTGVPSQILGSIEAPGQVYVINRNGIIFGGSSQVSTRGFVASTLPINDKLLAGQGLLINPDAQFLFSALPVPGKETSAFNPTITDPEFRPTEATNAYQLLEPLALDGSNGPVAAPTFSYVGTDGVRAALVAGTDYMLTVDPATKIATATLNTTGLGKLAGASVSVSYTPVVVKSGDITLQPGAVIKTPLSADGNGGRVMLVGANVTNKGRISTPAGQTILAAGQQVGIAAHASKDPSLRGIDVWVGAAGEGTGTVTNSGLITSMEGSVSLHGKAIAQLGAIDSSTSVNLNGRIDIRASYGAVSNPNFDNKDTIGSGAPPFVYQKTGSVIFGSDSVTRILPDYASERTVPGAALPEASQINVEGFAIAFKPRALMLAPNADVNIRAGVWPYKDADGDRTIFSANGTVDPSLSSHFANGEQRFLFSGGQIHLAEEALISVAGSTDVFVPLAQSVLNVEFRSSEFADSPLQREGVLSAIPITVDIRNTGVNDGRYWMGTPLGDVTGLAGLIQRNAAQLTAAGGNITLHAGESVVVQDGAKVDVSGGYYRHEAGMVQTSRLLQFGRLVDVTDALPGQFFEGVYTGEFSESSARWGITETFRVPWMSGAHFEESYVQGAPGGTLDITAPSMALDGELLGLTVSNPRERSVPEYSRLSITFAAEKVSEAVPTALTIVPTSPTPPKVTFSQSGGQTPVGTFQLVDGEPVALPADRRGLVVLSPELLDERGFGHLSVTNPDGDIIVPAGVNLVAPISGSISLTGANITIRSDVSAPGGSLSFTALNISPAFAAEFAITKGANHLPAPLPNVGRGLVDLAASAILSTAGLVIDDRTGAEARLDQPLVIDGGKIVINAYSANLASDSAINVSGGVAVDARGSVSYGDGGAISILTGKDPGVIDIGPVLGGTLVLNSTLAGYSGDKGGSLTIQATAIQIGGSAQFANTLLLAPSFFRTGGFTAYNLSGIGADSEEPAGPGEPDTYVPGITIAPGTRIVPVAENWRADTTEIGSVVLQRALNPVGLRHAVNLSFSALGADERETLEVIEVRGDLVMGAGAQIVTDPGAVVSFKGQTATILGSVFAPGGVISIAGANQFPIPNKDAVPATFARTTVHIGSDAILSTAGTAVVVPDEFGRRVGSVYSGGTISISGNIVAEAGSILDVSGASGTFDYHPSALGMMTTPVVPASSGLTTPLWSLQTVPVEVHSDGGLIDLTGSEMLFSDATLLGRAGGSTAVGGTLSIFSGRFIQAGTPHTSADINLVVTQGGLAIPAVNQTLGVGLEVQGAPAMGYFAANRFAAGGFASLDLGAKFVAGNGSGSAVDFGGNIEFRGPVSITAPGTLRVAGGGIIQSDSSVRLSASYLTVGQAFRPPLNPEDDVPPLFQQFAAATGVKDYHFLPTFGSGKLTIAANLVDAGTLSLQGIGRANLIGGDIRGNGTVNIAGELSLHAGQIYPTTLADFKIFAYDALDPDGSVLQTGSVTIATAGKRPAPYSVGGNLEIYASKISQGGVLRAPLGSITIGWNGSDIDPSDADIDIPFDPIANTKLTDATTVAVANQVVLKSGSTTSVSAVGMLIPYGLSPDGNVWIDPSGVDVTVGGLPTKQVVITGESVIKQRGSTIDLRGGGDLYAFRWVPGTGGSVDLLGEAASAWADSATYEPGDLVSFGGKTWSARLGNTGQKPTPSLYWTLVPESFAVLSGYRAGFAPYAPFNVGENADSLNGNAGLMSASLKVGDRVYLQGVPGLESGMYTLLPRRYALLPGAFLVTPDNQTPIGTVSLPDGASYVSGTTYNTFNTSARVSPVLTKFEVAPSGVVRNRVGYNDYVGNAFFTEAVARLNVETPQALPMDSGYLGLHGNTGLQVGGRVLAGHAQGGNGAAIDLSSDADTLYIIGGKGTAPSDATAVLKASVLNSWGADSLLIGGLRRRTADGNLVDIHTDNVVLDNPGSVFSGKDITLASNAKLTVTDGSALTSAGHIAGEAVPLVISGDGTLVRVSADSRAGITRTNRTDATNPLLTIGADVKLGGAGVILDSTYGTALDGTASFETRALTLGSGQISILLGEPSGSLAGSVVDQHLVLTGESLADIQQVRSLTLTSYRTIDVYGVGEFGSDTLTNLSLFAGGLRGYDQGAGTATFRVDNVLFANPSKVGNNLPSPTTSTGNLQFDAGTIRLGQNAFAVSGYENVTLNGTRGVLGQSTGGVIGTFATAGNLTITAPVITGVRSSIQQITAGGNLVLAQGEGEPGVRGGLGATFTFTGASVAANADVVLPSGSISLRATTGDVTVGGTLDASGTKREFYDLIRFTDAGTVKLTADAGNVTLAAGSNVSVASLSQLDGGVAGNAGTFIVKAGEGTFTLDAGATLSGRAGTGKTSGSFVLDVGSLPDFVELANVLNNGGFFEQRNLRVRTGDVVIDGTNTARNFIVSTDAGDIRVAGTGRIDVSGDTGGKISLISGGDLILESGATLTAHARKFSSAGKGGEILLEAGAAVDGIANLAALLDIQTGSTIDLGVDAYVAGDYTTVGSSAFNGKFTGTLHLRAPRNATNSDLGIAAIGGTIAGASSILVEGYEVMDLTGTNGVITGARPNATTLPSAGTVQRTVYDRATAFMSAANYDAMVARLLGSDTQHLLPALVLAPGVEIINKSGDITIGAPGSTSVAGDWNLADFRFGSKLAPGILTMRAAGDIVFNNSLSDGFTAVAPNAANGQSMLWLAPQMTINSNLPVNTQAWSFRLAAGSDLGAADFRAVLPTENLAPGKGSLLVGEFYAAVPSAGGNNATTAANIANGTGTRYEVVRTGAGSIEVAAGRDVQLRNQFATIYSAGVGLPNPQNVFGVNDFQKPVVDRSGNNHPTQSGGIGSDLGAIQQLYFAQWSMAGGDVVVSAQEDIGRFTLVGGEVVADSSRQLPNNWLYRRGFVDPVTGLFAVGGVTGAPAVNDPSASTTWWIDFSNFFQGFGALGGGDVSLIAGNDLVNADALIPTNARMSGRDSSGNRIAPDAAKLLELGGGDLVIRAGNNIDGGVYYVERGSGSLFAGGEITTNAARTPSLGLLGSSSYSGDIVQSNSPSILDPATWLPTTLFVGKSQFDVSARGDVLLGPATNPFLLPQGINNKFWYKTYFNTFSADASVTVSSFGGSVTHRLAVTLPAPGGISLEDAAEPTPILLAWLEQGILRPDKAAFYQPWTRLAEADLGSFSTVVTVGAPTLRSTAFAGDVNIVGDLTLFPSPKGSLELAASGGVIGLQPTGKTTLQNRPVSVWTSASINVSDADPSSIPGVTTPLAYATFVGRNKNASVASAINFYADVNLGFKETGSFIGAAATLESQQSLHARGLLHAADSEPVRLYASGGDIAGLTLYSPKAARLIADRDITDIAAYIQNLAATDISLVSAGRDIIPYNENSSLRSLASDFERNNGIGDAVKATVAGDNTLAMAGDIQISGPGVVEVLAGRNLDLGTGANLTDGTGVGITSIGNLRNPYLPFGGADIVAMAGVGGAGGGAALGLSGSSLDFVGFIREYLKDDADIPTTYLSKLGPKVKFDDLTPEQQAVVALEKFYLVLRDAGRAASVTDASAPAESESSATAGPADATNAGATADAAGYDKGFAAIDLLFGTSPAEGDILTRAREIRTVTGGEISLAAPAGGVTMASDIFGNPLTPPGVVTEFGGTVSSFTDGSVDIGQARIFTLRGGDIMIWSSNGDIAAGKAPKTVVTAPPTRVIIDAETADVQTDLGGLATGGGIGVLAAVQGVPEGNVDLIAPNGTVDAGDAGIRVTGNLNIAATTVLNASNIQAAGTSSGVSTAATVSAPPIAAMAAGSNAAAAASTAASQVAQPRKDDEEDEDKESVVVVEVIGYGGGEG